MQMLYILCVCFVIYFFGKATGYSLNEIDTPYEFGHVMFPFTESIFYHTDAYVIAVAFW